MYSVFVLLAVIVAVLLAFIVLIQESKGGGLASGFASSNQIMGVRKTTDFIEKATWTLAGLLVVFSVFSVFCLHRVDQTESITDKMTPAQTQQPVGVGAQQSAGQTAPAQQAK